MNEKKEIIKIIQQMTGKHSGYEIFSDWIQCSAIAISNAVTLPHGRLWEEREEEYASIIKKYNKEEQLAFSDMLYLLTAALEHDMGDVLGEILMESDMGNKRNGQFFTPYHVSKMCADIVSIEPNKNGIYEVSDPSCGSGGMIIAIAQSLADRGVNYQRKMHATAQDIEWRAVHTCYVQLSLLGISATCVQGDTLNDPYRKGYETRRVMYTPEKMGVLI